MQGSLNAYAKHRKFLGLQGGNLMAVQKARDSGRISVVQDANGNYVVDFEKADAQWAANTHPTQGRETKAEQAARSQPGGRAAPADRTGIKADATNGDSAAVNATSQKFSLGRAAKMAYEAATAELNYKVRVGELVERSKERSDGKALAVEIKDKLLGIPDRLSALLAAESDPLKIHVMLTDELIIAIERISQAVNEL
jgi:hypothetical protein